jgi:phosphatidylethanolamine/phosphatidyl-N-methylethanolamine N-methyltransferase
MPSSRAADAPLPQRMLNNARRFLGPWGIFFKGFIRHPRMVGAIVPSSHWVVESMLDKVDWANCDLFVEYGPGVGTFCQAVLDRLKPDARLLVIDLNPEFIDYLSKEFRDNRFMPVHGSAADVRQIIKDAGFDHADYVLSGLPFSTLPNNLGPVIAEETAKAIRTGGAFLVYQYRARARDFMAPHFAKIDHGHEYRNLPPCHLFWGWKS